MSKGKLPVQGKDYKIFPKTRTEPGFFKRSLQAAVVSFWIGSSIFLLTVAQFIIFYSFVYISWSRIFILAYFCWMVYDAESAFAGRKSQIMRKIWFHLPLWDYFRGYFSAQLVQTCTLDPNQKYLMGFHPHGVYALSVMSNILFNRHWEKAFPGIEIMMPTLPVNFWIPLWRELCLAVGGGTCQRESVIGRLKNSEPGSSMMISLGGAEEFIHMKGGTMDLVIMKRMGFVKIAIESGAQLVPIIGFGENELFTRITHPYFDPIHWIFRNTMRAAAPLFMGNYWLFLPGRRPLITVVGKPIEVKQKDNPSKEEIRELHAAYLNCLQDLYDEYKDLFHTYRTQEMRFVA